MSSVAVGTNGGYKSFSRCLGLGSILTQACTISERPCLLMFGRSLAASPSLRTKDPDEAQRKHAVEAVRVLQQLDDLRRRLAALSAPSLAELDASTIKRVGEAYYVHLLEEDDEQRVAGFRTPERLPDAPTPTFEKNVADERGSRLSPEKVWAKGEV